MRSFNRAMDREELIVRLSRWRPGRRGFGGSDDPIEAAEAREAIRGDHDLNPGETAAQHRVAAGRGAGAAYRSRERLVGSADPAHGASVRPCRADCVSRRAHRGGGRRRRRRRAARNGGGGRPAARARVGGRPARHLRHRHRVRDHADRRRRRPALSADDRSLRGRRGVRGAARPMFSTPATIARSSANRPGGPGCFLCCPTKAATSGAPPPACWSIWPRFWT